MITFSAIPGSGAFVFCISSLGNGSKTAAGGGMPRVEYRRFIKDSTLDLSLAGLVGEEAWDQRHSRDGREA